MMIKPKITPTPFSGCFGYSMSCLDIDEHLAGLLEHCRSFDIGLIESGVYNAEIVYVLHRSSTPKIQ